MRAGEDARPPDGVRKRASLPPTRNAAPKMPRTSAASIELLRGAAGSGERIGAEHRIYITY